MPTSLSGADSVSQRLDFRGQEGVEGQQEQKYTSERWSEDEVALLVTSSSICYKSDH